MPGTPLAGLLGLRAQSSSQLNHLEHYSYVKGKSLDKIPTWVHWALHAAYLKVWYIIKRKKKKRPCFADSTGRRAIITQSQTATLPNPPAPAQATISFPDQPLFIGGHCWSQLDNVCGFPFGKLCCWESARVDDPGSHVPCELQIAESPPSDPISSLYASQSS